ncbi:YafY family protein [Dysgonomonas sp. Marseille-P4361]|uniref:helix-turn-helix transcriptional regulator n=1 Tax=Dysgonomonas sp. Marseille-P4361 TaxID=2161820 RepID=UPI000D54D10A|nr:YafY family protein [Dysgonomonas sp. Marseille-P4361]
MNRIDRLSAILTMLQSSPSVKPKQITERFSIGIRTVYRDIRALEESGIPIAGDSRSGYSLVEGFKLPPLMFTKEEAFAFLAAERLIDKFTDTGLREGYKSGVDKIRAVMRLSEKELITAVDTKIGKLDFDSPSLGDSQDRMQTILDSVSKQKQIIITYTSHSKNEKMERIIDPIGIFFSMTNWYMIGFCNTRNDYRTFKISRITGLQLSNIPIGKEHPPLNQFLKNLQDQTELQKVIIEVEAKDLPIIDESKYYQGLVHEIRKKDIVEMHFMTFSLERLARWYLSYMDIATIIHSTELKQIATTIIQKHK